MKNIGIWLDKEKAHIVTIENGKELLITIPSNIENYHVYGGSGTRFKGGPQDVVQDSKYLEREKHQFKAYFKDIVNSIKNAHALAIFGPAETYKKFEKELCKNYPKLNSKIKGIQRMNSRTENQTIASVRDFFLDSK